jgi:uncharacterized membrane protein YjfL (UPF0719 family)
MDDVFTEIASGFLYGAVGIVLLLVGFLLIDLLTPGRLGHLIIHDRNRSAGIVAAAGFIAVGGIVTTAIASADGSLGEGLAETAVYGGVGVLMLALAFLVLDLVTPGRLGEHVVGEGEQPAAWMAAAALVSVGAIVAAAIS